MSKNKNVDTVQRWMKLDVLLDQEWNLTIKRCAERLNVSEKTIRRDIEAFRELGQDIGWEYSPERDGRYYYTYFAGDLPLFSETLRRRRT